jgi:hypothetical protein
MLHLIANLDTGYFILLKRVDFFSKVGIDLFWKTAENVELLVKEEIQDKSYMYGKGI